MTDRDQELWTRFRRQGIATGFPPPSGNRWADAIYDLARAYRLEIEWLPADQAEQARGSASDRQLRCSYPTDCRTGMLALTEATRVALEINDPGIRRRPKWLQELRISEAAIGSLEARDFTAADIDSAEFSRSRRLVNEHLRPALRSGIKPGEIRAACKRPSLLRDHGEWTEVGRPSFNGNGHHKRPDPWPNYPGGPAY
jgi:hypothetical protein